MQKFSTFNGLFSRIPYLHSEANAIPIADTADITHDDTSDLFSNDDNFAQSATLPEDTIPHPLSIKAINCLSTIRAHDDAVKALLRKK